ncbi:uncharacterized protein [Euwallacea similis]|uniref:uncharacterized protein isoform X1 n=1 Tax=Euwallacea similis TaxID=1736056 RepID=UPI00344FA36A
MFGNMVISCVNPEITLPKPESKIIQDIAFPIGILDMKRERTAIRRTHSCDYDVHIHNPEYDKRKAGELVDELLMEIYNSGHNGTTDYYSTSGKSQRGNWIEVVDLHVKDAEELRSITWCLREHICRTGSVLVRHLKRRDALRRQQQALCDVISGTLNQRLPEPADMRFTIQPTPGESGFSQWVAAMKMVAQLPGGIPPEFRSRLWVTMAERHLASRKIEWSEVEKSCFSEWSHPADAELGIQIVKDLHRTGCSLFCGEDGQENQALLKKVLLAYARWNKAVGYCQGFNMLAALILQVTDRNESDALKLMIYLIEGVLPDSYFADSLRGLSVDMAVFRELLRSKLPRLSKHLDLLQNAVKDGSRSYEPPLTNVFTMQWFLTLFCNCLPQPTVLRVWDLIFLEGNEILLRTALAIWQVLAQRILVVHTADEFYCIMGALTRELLESNLIDANTLVKAIVTIGPLTELKNLRDHYLYNITPWGTSIPQSAPKQINLHPKHSIPLDISSLKKQYVKLKQRQRQAHVIFSSAISRHPQRAAPVAMNHLLVGKRALIPAKRLGPPKGSIPPARQTHPTTLQWKDAQKSPSSSSSSDTELCDDEVQSSSDEEPEKPQSNSQYRDNLNSGDTSLMKADNTPDDSATLTIPPESAPNSDSLRTSPINITKLASDSEDESAEFESFLADRVKCIKVIEAEEDSGNVNVSSSTRRNSELALQIIQENSLILHRIMQCQSRLSPSPPPLAAAAETSVEDSIPEATDNQKMENVCCWVDTQSKYCNPESTLKSRYHSILEKSKSLDERYNNLFSTSTFKDKNMPLLHESKSESLDYHLHSPPLDIDLFDPILSNNGSEDTLTLQSLSDDGAKDSRSSQLIQENLDLLRTFSTNKAKEQQQERDNMSRKLMKENVDLLESISNERQFRSDLNDPIIKNLDSNDPNLNFDEVPKIIADDISLTFPKKDKDSAISSQAASSSHYLINLDDDFSVKYSKSVPLNLSSEKYVQNCDTSLSDAGSSKLSLDLDSPRVLSTSIDSLSVKSLSPNVKSSSSKMFSDHGSKVEGGTPVKSPSKVFNPFPVALNSRQSKEVPLKLGLYKK